MDLGNEPISTVIRESRITETDKPVAWINNENIVAVGQCPKDFIHSWKPLYDHPAKTLTDEEMLKTVRSYLPSGVEIACAQQLGWSHEYMLGYNDALREVRARLAILRKAQEK